MLNVKALLFDLDGTLVDTAAANVAAYGRALAEVGVTVEPEAFAAVAAGRNWREFLPDLLARAGVAADPAAVARRKGELYPEMIGELRVNGPLLALAASSRAAMRTAIVTTASAANVRAIVQRYELTGLFDLIVTGDDVSRHKPDPEAYRHAAVRLDLRPDECLAFEDSEIGVASARAAGVAVVQIVF